MYSKPDDTYDQNEEGDEVVGRKSPKIGKLKKDRCKSASHLKGNIRILIFFV